MKCIITDKRGWYYKKSDYAFLGLSIPEFTRSIDNAMIFQTKKEAEKIAKTISGATIIKALKEVK